MKDVSLKNGCLLLPCRFIPPAQRGKKKGKKRKEIFKKLRAKLATLYRKSSDCRDPLHVAPGRAQLSEGWFGEGREEICSGHSLSALVPGFS